MSFKAIQDAAPSPWSFLSSCVPMHALQPNRQLAVSPTALAPSQPLPCSAFPIMPFSVFPTVSVSYCCCNELAWTLWLKITLIYSLIIWRPESRHQSHCAKVKVSEDWFLPEVLEKYPFPFLFYFLETTRIPCLVAPSLHITRTSCFHCHTSLISFCFPLIKTLKITFRFHLDHSEYSLHLKIVNLILSAKSLLPHKVTFTGSND